MEAIARIKELMKERGWTDYRLAKESGLSQSTISNMFNRSTAPSIQTLQSICDGLGITLSQFFAEGEMVSLSDEQKELFDQWVLLSSEQKEAIQKLIQTMK